MPDDLDAARRAAPRIVNPGGGDQPQVTSLDLDKKGRLRHPVTGDPVAEHLIAPVLAQAVPVPPDVTDIVVLVHGWNTGKARAVRAAGEMIGHVEQLIGEQREMYARLPAGGSHRLYLVLRWPSLSLPLVRGYRRIRDRAHSLTTEGNAAQVVATLLGYLNEERVPPKGATARAAEGQYLTCVGHSFGGRLLCQAVQESALSGSGTAGPVHVDPRYPYTVDNLLVFQMAARPDSFAEGGVFQPLLTAAPISGPVTLTRSGSDRATGIWHWLAERTGGIGTVGVRDAVSTPGNVVLRKTRIAYDQGELGRRLVEVDASWKYRGRWWSFTGGHSDFRHPESAHLLLSLMNFSR